MQITLTQVEIEQALKSFINEQVKINDGVTIGIELKAGRGVDGFSATINIGSVVEVIQPAPVVHQPIPRTKTAKPESATVVETVKTQTTEAIAPAAGSVTTAGTDTGNSEQPDPEPAEQTVAGEVIDEPTPAPAARSLFSGLQKPVNK